MGIMIQHLQLNEEALTLHFHEPWSSTNMNDHVHSNHSGLGGPTCPFYFSLAPPSVYNDMEYRERKLTRHANSANKDATLIIDLYILLY